MSYNYWNISLAEGIKRKITKNIFTSNRYHENSWWNMWRGISKSLCSLQEMNRRVNDCHMAWHQQKYRF